MYPLQEVKLDGMLGNAVSELVKKLAAIGESQIPLVQLEKHRKCVDKRGLVVQG